MDENNINFVMWQNKIDEKVLKLWKKKVQTDKEFEDIKEEQKKIWKLQKGIKNEN